ncbi:MAG: zinc-dependent alcohol dehydrogenase family protein [Acidobacteriota bacterium]
MLALEIAQLETLRLIQTEPRQMGPHDLLLRVAASGICGTDPHILHGVYPASLPVIPGHEYAGIVEAFGSEVDGFQIGTPVAVDPNIVCNECYFCRRGKSHLCSRLVALGVSIPGGCAEYSVVPASQAYPLPPGFPLAYAALTEPLACCIRGVDLCGVSSGDRCVIFGAGPMGAMILQLLAMQGASHLTVVEPQAGRRRKAQELGATLVVDPHRDDPVSAIRDVFPEGVEVVFDCSGDPTAIRHALQLVMRGGTVMLFAVCAKRHNIDLNPFWVNDNEITIRGSYNNPYTHSRAIQLLVSGRLNAGKIVTHRFPLSQAQDAFACAGSSESLKVVIEP